MPSYQYSTIVAIRWSHNCLVSTMGLPILVKWHIYIESGPRASTHKINDSKRYQWSFIWINTLRPRQNARHFKGDTFRCIFLNENVRISFKISMKFVPYCPINNILALVQIMAWRRPGDKPLSEPMAICLLTHICVTRPQWVNIRFIYYCCFQVDFS